MWLCSSLRYATPVARIEDRELQVDQELTEQLTAFLKQDLPVNHPLN